MKKTYLVDYDLFDPKKTEVHEVWGLEDVDGRFGFAPAGSAKPDEGISQALSIGQKVMAAVDEGMETGDMVIRVETNRGMPADEYCICITVTPKEPAPLKGRERNCSTCGRGRGSSETVAVMCCASAFGFCGFPESIGYPKWMPDWMPRWYLKRVGIEPTVQSS